MKKTYRKPAVTAKNLIEGNCLMFNSTLINSETVTSEEVLSKENKSMFEPDKTSVWDD